MTKEWYQLGAMAGLIIGATWVLAIYIGSIEVKQAAIEQRMNSIEQLEHEHHADDVASRAVVGQQLTLIQQSIAQAQIEISKLGPRGK